jgi:hypothetical protein
MKRQLGVPDAVQRERSSASGALLIRDRQEVAAEWSRVCSAPAQTSICAAALRPGHDGGACSRAIWLGAGKTRTILCISPLPH